MIHVYIRCSTEDQAKVGNSPEAQMNAIEAVAKFRGLDLSTAEIYQDIGVSGFRKKFDRRPGGGKLMSQLCKGDIIICAAFDRMFRDSADGITKINEFEKLGVRLIICQFGDQFADTGTSIGKLLLSILAVFAEFESQRISERTKAGLEVARKSGDWSYCKQAPVGYRWVRMKVRNEKVSRASTMVDSIIAARYFYDETDDPDNNMDLIAKKLNIARVPLILYYRTKNKVTRLRMHTCAIHYWDDEAVRAAIYGQEFAYNWEGYEEPESPNASKANAISTRRIRKAQV